jgi:hypothetical protein
MHPIYAIFDPIYEFLNATFPGPPLEMTDWRQYCQSMLLAAMFSAGVGWVVFLIKAYFQSVSEPKHVFALNQPYRHGIIGLWILMALWAIIFISFSGKARGFLNFNSFFIVVLYGLLAWLICSVLITYSSRLPRMRRYRYVTYLSRRF